MEHIDTLTCGKKKLIRAVRNGRQNFDQIIAQSQGQKWLAPIVCEDYGTMIKSIADARESHSDQVSGVMLYGG